MSPNQSQPLSQPEVGPNSCGCGSSGCGPQPVGNLGRREFLQLVGAGAAGTLLTQQWHAALAAVAGPFGPEDFEKLVPADKKFSAEWLKSLFERGTPTVYRGAELEHIGMPIGGICCGQVYLGGDGTLWHWDIFNQPTSGGFNDSNGPHYAKPVPPKSPIQQSFYLLIEAEEKNQTRKLDKSGFREIAFWGQYPIGQVQYRDADSPVAVDLEAFSPFIPLNADDSGLPVTIMNFTVKNTSAGPVSVVLGGSLENGVCIGAGKEIPGQRRNRIVRGESVTYVRCTAEPPPPGPKVLLRAPIVFEQFENPTYKGWTATGTAFGDGPVELAKRPQYMGAIGGQGARAVNTHNVAHDEDVQKADEHVGTLTSDPFTIQRKYITFLLGGGNHPNETCVNLLIEDKAVRTVTGRNSNLMRPCSLDVSEFEGKTGRIQVVDNFKGGWGQISIDDIVFADEPREAATKLEAREDFGSMCLGLLDPQAGDQGWSQVGASVPTIDDLLGKLPATAPFGEKLTGNLTRRMELQPGESKSATFVIAWHFPRVWSEPLAHITGIAGLRRAYANRFDSAAAVLRHVAENIDELSEQTRLWRDTWYGSTLPHWFLDRTFLNTSIAATSTCYRFDNERFYGWEGNYCCAGTCTHVWQYAQAIGRVFPALERATREMVDFGLAFHDDTGAMDYRAEAHQIVAHDGQAGTILRAYREHLTAADDGYLKRCWPRIRKSVEYLIHEDGNDDGLLEGAQYNTLDAAWYGPMGWLSSLYLAAVRAGQAMADELGDAEFSKRCATLVERGSRNLVEKLYDGEYFIHRQDPAHPEANNTNRGCHIDQVFGQSWAWQVGLGRVIPRDQTLSALRALWKYSFTPDVGLYREGIKGTIKGGRWYAMAGEGGLLMCTFPKGGADQCTGKGGDAWAAGYFNECMNGFEYQVAGHMVWEGLVQEGLAITRMLHDRYHGSKRNPWNEIECGDHYARSMASYGIFLASCGFDYHGPKGRIGFAPRIAPENFRAAFTAAEGWGTYAQERTADSQKSTIQVRWGSLRLREIVLELAAGRAPKVCKIERRDLGNPGNDADAREPARASSIVMKDGHAWVTLAEEMVLRPGEILVLSL